MQILYNSAKYINKLNITVAISFFFIWPSCLEKKFKNLKTPFNLCLGKFSI